MSNKVTGSSSPTLTFKAGGKKNKNEISVSNKKKTESSAHDRSTANENGDGAPHREKNIQIPPLTPPSSKLPPSRSSASKSNILTIITTGLAHKRSPFSLQNWIACVLTLDGRDKFTKVLQYTSRLLCWYLAGLAGRGVGNKILPAAAAAGASAAGEVGSPTPSILHLIFNTHANAELRSQFFLSLSKRFNSLYKSLVTSRKAFRLGRSFIEYDKICSMGWGSYLGYLLTHPLAEVAADKQAGHKKSNNVGIGEGKVMGKSAGQMGSRGSLARYDTHPIPEEEEEDALSHSDGGDDTSWSGDENEQSLENEGEEKKLDEAVKKKVVARPGRPKLPSRISSNVGWGPSTTTTSDATAPQQKEGNKKGSATKNAPVARTVSELGREMYRPFPSSSSIESYKQLKDEDVGSAMALANAIEKTTTTQSATPTWKLVGGTIKLLGLMGFWAFDNVSFLTSSGFLDPICLGSSSGSSADVNKGRAQRKQRASELAGRCYFFGVLGGLYVNVRALFGHRYGALRDARLRLKEAIVARSTKANDKNEDEDDSDNIIQEAKAHLKKIEQKHFELMLALLKSLCDFMVFSNNPGIDLHLKFRGKKNHEGLHCLGGLVSASTVLYNNFPNENAKK